MKKLLSALLATMLLVTCIPISVHAASNAEIIFDFLKNDIGFNSAAACGVLANIEKESSFNPNASGDNGASYGICQWNTFRFTALQNWCGANGYDYTTLDGQLHYLQFELSANNSNYLWNGKTIYNKLIAVTDTAEGAYTAAYDWCYYFEVPANRQKRAIERGDLAVSTYWPAYGEGEPAPTIVEALPCDYTVTIGANVGDVVLYDRPTINVESARRLTNQEQPLSIRCTEQIRLSNDTVRYYFYAEDEERGYYLSWDPDRMTLQPTHVWENGVCTLCGEVSPTTVTITAQPKTTYAKEGGKISVTVDAAGDGLNYQWYIKNNGGSKYSKSSVTAATYSATMSDKVHGRRVYCVVTDQYGNRVQSATALLRRQVTITKESATAAYAKKGAATTIKVTAVGDELTYTWYFRNDGKTAYSKSSVKTATYSTKMSSTAKNRRVYCIVKDKYGKKVQSKTFLLRESVSIVTQPKTVSVKKSATARVSVKASGDGLRYTWYVKDAGAKKYTKSSITKSTYSVKMSAKVKNRLVYCVVKDKYGKTVKSTTVKLKMK